MPDRLRHRLVLLGFVLLCSLGSLSAAWQVRHWGNELSPVDPFSESNAIREARNFLDTGLAANDGLGNALRPDLYPDEGFQGYPATRAHSLTPSGVYTHYPPGPEYILYLAMRLLGTHSIARLRAAPLLITWLATLYFGLALRRRFGTAVAAAVMLACAALPMFSDADSFLHYDGYAFALLLVEIGVAIGVNRRVLPFALLGFTQGWLSFDYFFLVALVPAAVEQAMPRLDRSHTARLKLAALRCVAAAAGFALAHLLHFAEICAFFGSFRAALADLSGAAAYRTGEFGPLFRIVLTCHVLAHYLLGELPAAGSAPLPDVATGDLHAFRFTGLSIGAWWLLLTLLFLAIRLRGRDTRRGANSIDSDWLAVSLCGIVPSCLWYVAMPEHAYIHEHFLYRHLFLGFFLALLFAATVLVNALAAAANAIGRKGALITQPWR